MTTKEQFEIDLLNAHKANLKDPADAKRFTEMALGEMYCSERDSYFDADGDEFYYEIPANETKSGNPVVV